MEVDQKVRLSSSTFKPSDTDVHDLGMMGYISSTVLSEGGSIVGVIPSAMIAAVGEGSSPSEAATIKKLQAQSPDVFKANTGPKREDGESRGGYRVILESSQNDRVRPFHTPSDGSLLTLDTRRWRFS